MAHPTTPHTQTQQNRTPEQTDLEPDQLEQTAGTGSDAELYNRREGAQSGTKRGPHVIPASGGAPNTQPAPAAFEGSVTTRTPGGKKQGISSRSADDELPGQQDVVKDRPDAKAGVNHSR
jgi:hypothetical protein